MLSIVPFFSMALLRYYSFKHAAHGSDTVYITTSDLTISIPSTDFTRFAFIAAAFRLEKIIIVLDLPGHFGDLAISYLVSHKPSWYPYPLTKEVWRCFTYPFFALPAWWFVGLGIDTFLGRRRVGRKGLAVSLVLGLIFAVVAAGLRFGLTPEERLEQDQLSIYIMGLALWSLLFLIPFAAWLRWRSSNTNATIPTREMGA